MGVCVHTQINTYFKGLLYEDTSEVKGIRSPLDGVTGGSELPYCPTWVLGPQTQDLCKTIHALSPSCFK